MRNTSSSLESFFIIITLVWENSSCLLYNILYLLLKSGIKLPPTSLLTPPLLSLPANSKSHQLFSGLISLGLPIAFYTVSIIPPWKDSFGFYDILPSPYHVSFVPLFLNVGIPPGSILSHLLSLYKAPEWRYPLPWWWPVPKCSGYQVCVFGLDPCNHPFVTVSFTRLWNFEGQGPYIIHIYISGT